MQSSDITHKVAREESPGSVKSHHVMSSAAAIARFYIQA
jgi:hypothetical protein